MKIFFNWLLRNLSNVFGLIGILITIYFGAIYAPSWIKETQTEKLNISKRQTIQSIKELVFSDSTVSVSEIKAIVIAKELDENVRIPYSFYEILTLSQLSFMEDKFLPLSKRKELIGEIEILKDQVLPEQIGNELNKTKEKQNKWSWVTILTALISLLVSFAGVISFYKKFNVDKEKQEEINNDIEQSAIFSSHNYALNMEDQFITIFHQINGINVSVSNRDEGYDLYFSKDNKSYYVEFKFLMKSKVGLGSFRQFINCIKDKPGEAWFIYNTDLTPLVLREAKEFNERNKEIFLRLIKVTNATELEDRVKELLHTTSVL